jgi:glc operon protein GlcG
MRLTFVTVDVFTDRQFGGNPLAVVVDCAGLSSRQMQAIAAEFNLAETTFVLPPQDAAHTAQVRIFTPRAEMPFAGHPNVGTAFVLAREGRCHGRPVGGETMVFEEAAGLVRMQLIRQGADVVGARLSAPQALVVGDAVALRPMQQGMLPGRRRRDFVQHGRHDRRQHHSRRRHRARRRCSQWRHEQIQPGNSSGADPGSRLRRACWRQKQGRLIQSPGISPRSYQLRAPGGTCTRRRLDGAPLLVQLAALTGDPRQDLSMYVAAGRRLTHRGAKQMAATAVAKAEQAGIAITVAVADAGGHLMVLERMDGGRFHTVHSSTTKAVCAASNKRPTTAQGAQGQPLDVAHAIGLALAAGPECWTAMEGGFPVIVEGECIGGIGVSGGDWETDARIAREAISSIDAAWSLDAE